MIEYEQLSTFSSRRLNFDCFFFQKNVGLITMKIFQMHGAEWNINILLAISNKRPKQIILLYKL